MKTGKFIQKYCVLSLLLLLFVCKGFQTMAQQNESQSVAVSSVVFSKYQLTEKKPRKLLNLKEAKWTTKINPVTYIAVGLMYTYQNVFSEQISANCTYEISCSEMTKKSIEKHGLIKGTFIGLHQLTNCFPGARYDHCDHAISSGNQIINVVE